MREWIIHEASAAGEDFRKALLFEGNLEPAPDYSDALITDNTGTGAPLETLPQIRQRALKSIVLRTLPDNGASWHVVKLCKRYGARVWYRMYRFYSMGLKRLRGSILSPESEFTGPL